MRVSWRGAVMFSRRWTPQLKRGLHGARKNTPLTVTDGEVKMRRALLRLKHRKQREMRLLGSVDGHLDRIETPHHVERMLL